MDLITFDGKGPLAAALTAAGRPVFPRAVQAQYADLAREGFASGAPVALDAETGVGKTFGYLVAAIEHAQGLGGARVIVATSSVALQRQILDEDLPIIVDAVRRAGGGDLDIALRVGRRQIIDVNALRHSIDSHSRWVERGLADQLIDWVESRIQNSQLPLYDDMLEVFSDRMRAAPVWLSRDLVGYMATKVAPDPRVTQLYEEMLLRASAADVLIVNHHLYALSLVTGILWRDERENVVVIDEAHKLPDVVVAMGREKVPFLHYRSALMKAAGTSAERKGIETRFNALLRDLDALAERVLDGEKEILGFDHFDREEREALSGILDPMIKMGTDLENTQSVDTEASVEALVEVARFRDSLISIRGLLNVARGSKGALYCTPVRGFLGVTAIDPGDSRRIAWQGWKGDLAKCRGLLFTSATLTTKTASENLQPKAAMRKFMKESGFLDQDMERSVFGVLSPEKFGAMAFVRPPVDMPRPFLVDEVETEGDDAEIQLNPAAVQIWARMVLAAAEQGGRVLVLCPAFRDIEAIAACLPAWIQERLIVQTRGTGTAACTKRFLARNDSIWLSASVWEGLSLPGAISHIVIPRIPFRAPETEDAIILNYYEQVLGSVERARTRVMTHKLSEARRRLRQGIGRGIRSAGDSVTIWIGDWRWPLTQEEIDRDFQRQPVKWSSSLLDAIPERFRRRLASSPRFELEAGAIAAE